MQSLARSVIDACAQDPDAFLAALHLDRQHPYLVVQQLLGAALTELAAAELQLDAPTRRSLACAALTRDVALLPLQGQLDRQAGALTRE